MDSCGTVRGEDGVDGRAEIANGFLAPKYFHELRDKQQLGYVVHSGISASARLMMFDSSSDYAPDVLAHGLMPGSQMHAELQAMPQTEFEALRQALRLLEEDRTLDERFGTLWFEATDLNGQFHDKKRLRRCGAYIDA